MQPIITEISTALTIRQLRRDRSLAPRGSRFPEVVAVLAPMVHGTATSLLEDAPTAAEEITGAVFDCLVLRWKSLPRSTVLATWLIQTTNLAAIHERRRLRLPKLPGSHPIAVKLKLLQAIRRLPIKLRNIVVVRFVLSHFPDFSALALGIKPLQLERLENKALARITRKIKKFPIASNLPAFLRSLPVDLPASLASSLTSRFIHLPARPERTSLAAAILAAWQWLKIREFARATVQGLAYTLLIILCLVGSFAYLLHNGYLTPWFIRNGGKDLVKQIPELAEPGKLWPVTPEEESHVSRQLPDRTGELYGMTNIWLAKLTFTKEQWKGIQPSRVRPVRNLMGNNGRLDLRNTNASRSGLAGAVGIEFVWTEAALQFANTNFARVAVRFRGNGTYLNSLYGPKQSFKIDLNRLIKGQKIAGIDELNLLNSIPDYSYIRDSMAQKLFRDLGVPGPRTAYTYLTIDAPGTFTNHALGLYVLVENIDKDYAENRFGTKKTPIFKPVTYDLFQDLGDDWKIYAPIYDLKTSVTPQQQNRLIKLAKLTSHASDADFAAQIADYVDLENFAAFVAGHVLLSSYDGFLANGQNFYIYMDPLSDKIGFISWDQDHSWGEFGYVGTAEKREQASIWEPAAYDFRFLRRIFKVEAFRSAYRASIEQALVQFFTEDRLYAQIDQLATMLRPAVAAENPFRLKRFDQSLTNVWMPGPRDGQPEGPNAPVHQIKRFIPNRIKSIRAQLDGQETGVSLRRERM